MIRPILLLLLFVVLATALFVVLFQLAKELGSNSLAQEDLVGPEVYLETRPELIKNESEPSSAVLKNKGVEKILTMSNEAELLKGELEALILKFEDGNEQYGGEDLRNELAEIIAVQQSLSRLTKRRRVTSFRTQAAADEVQVAVARAQQGVIDKYGRFFQKLVGGRKGATTHFEWSILRHIELTLLEGRPVKYMARVGNSVSLAIRNQERALGILEASFELFRFKVPLLPPNAPDSLNTPQTQAILRLAE